MTGTSHRPLATLALCLMLALASCTAEPEPERVLSTPGAVVTDWLTALEALDLEELATTTDPANLALVAGAENAFDVDQMVSVVEDGLPPATARSYWTTFREGLTAFFEPPIDTLDIEDVERFTIDTRQFAAVTVRRGDATAEVVTGLEPEGWRVDLMATAGPALAVQVRRLVATIIEQSDDATAARTYARIAVESLGAALERDPEDRALELEVEAIEELPVDLGR